MTPMEMLAGCRPYIRASLVGSKNRLKMARQSLEMSKSSKRPWPPHLSPANYVSALEAEEKRLQELLDGIDRICGF